MGVLSPDIDAFFEAYSGVYAEETVKERRRMLARLDRLVTGLFEDGLLSCPSCPGFALEDAKRIAAAVCSNRGLGVNSVGHALGALNKLCKFRGNAVFETAKHAYPALFPRKQERRIPVLSPEDYARAALYVTREGQSLRELRSSGAVALSLGAACRAQEGRLMLAGDVDLARMEVFVRRVKGSASYGMSRTVPLDPAFRGLFERLLSAAAPPLLFPGPSGGPLSPNAYRLLFRRASEGCGVPLSATVCRATWGQRLLDSGLRSDYLSECYGHMSECTTRKYYARVSHVNAGREVRRIYEQSSAKNALEADLKNTGQAVKSGYGAEEGIRTPEARTPPVFKTGAVGRA